LRRKRDNSTKGKSTMASPNNFLSPITTFLTYPRRTSCVIKTQSPEHSSSPVFAKSLCYSHTLDTGYISTTEKCKSSTRLAATADLSANRRFRPVFTTFLFLHGTLCLLFGINIMQFMFSQRFGGDTPASSTLSVSPWVYFLLGIGLYIACTMIAIIWLMYRVRKLFPKVIKNPVGRIHSLLGEPRTEPC
jgi:hypothetical protein